MESLQGKTGPELAQELAPLVTCKQAAVVLGCTPRMVLKLCNAGKLRAVRVGTHWRVNRDALLAYAGLSE